ncbi:hemolysin-III channel protein-like protein Izh2 [Piptocephalis cylindrospora]|uniref:Hemolysin-III channel protein-like protein Izh2 n=1 Tax=Piptocephalis cylindrospora TaxID=1907219 RepID=A0A4P9Y4R4_9FUNG|nr:hemolysin-III channel protein-like protein Izh2 [Piptocephalis cylindrospora]|eukprot:RKP13966.1 hemolysin-III channel protein-like protein Izh2 [Piptocephalis cylindrospora]
MRQRKEAKKEATSVDGTTAGHAGPRSAHTYLYTWDDLPAWMRDNRYILTGYRPPALSYLSCFKSLGYVHNESGNIYSHLLGALAYLSLGVYTLYQLEPLAHTAEWTDYMVMVCFFAGAVGCLTCSSAFHLLSCHSEGVCKAWNRCDHLGIVILIVGSYYPAVYYLFYCSPFLLRFCLTSISILGGMTAWACFSPRFQGHEFIWARIAIFIALGTAGIVPIGYSVYLHGWEHAMTAMQLPYYLAMGLSYISGALIYAARYRIPEKWFPGRFDIYFHSHQIFHFCVLAGVFAHYLGVMHSFIWRHTNNPACIPGLDML